MFDKLNNADWKVLSFLLDNPYKEFHLRGVARTLKISASSVKTAVDKLEKLNLVKSKAYANLRMISGNKEEILFKHLKISKNIDFLRPLVEELLPAIAVMLYGSYAKGENDEKSDIDIVVIANRKDAKLHEYKGKELQVYFFTPADWAKMKKTNQAYAKEVSGGILLHGEQGL
ncbi:MAG: nucleotidyltransferase domain-containing protein [Candidatus Nanoarchaeia archaeon]